MNAALLLSTLHSRLVSKRGLKSSWTESSVRAKDQDFSDARDRASISARGIYRGRDEARVRTEPIWPHAIRDTHRHTLTQECRVPEFSNDPFSVVQPLLFLHMQKYVARLQILAQL